MSIIVVIGKIRRGYLRSLALFSLLPYLCAKYQKRLSQSPQSPILAKSLNDKMMVSHHIAVSVTIILSLLSMCPYVIKSWNTIRSVIYGKTS